MIPFSRGREKSDSGVFFTVPCAVAMTTKRSSSKLFTGSTALIRSPSASGKRLTIGRPRLARVPAGTSYPFSQYTWPRLEKHRMKSWVWAMNTRSMKSSSRIDAACFPRPPRRCAR